MHTEPFNSIPKKVFSIFVCGGILVLAWIKENLNLIKYIYIYIMHLTCKRLTMRYKIIRMKILKVTNGDTTDYENQLHIWVMLEINRMKNNIIEYLIVFSRLTQLRIWPYTQSKWVNFIFANFPIGVLLKFKIYLLQREIFRMSL